ncbi:hypothetical protein [Rhizorhabdus histidinilytica]|uniref:hypothetical protein n=1 Tax=Rhizorhabdus histidinilytica TaxID=439228 RepID=UPI00321FFA5D
MKKLPCLLYRSPGGHVMPGLDAPTYDYIGVATEDDYRARLAQGWFETRDQAIGRAGAEKAVEAADALHDAVDEIEKPARKALEAEARALGVSFNWKTSDQALAERIAAKKD